MKKIEDRISEKAYTPENMTDLAGIRIITLIESDVQRVCDLITTMFNVHDQDSVNKSEKLGEEKVGYRSVHFVCDVGDIREQLPEFSAYKGFCFEIQIRTALEHAWAEIEHDRGYKLGGKLPSQLNRRFKLLSGLLESADLEFNRLTVEIEEYAKQFNVNIKQDKLDYELTSIGLKAFLFDKYACYVSEKNIQNDNQYIDLAVKELNQFGIDNFQELDQLINEYINKYNFDKGTTVIGFMRFLMMFIDLEKYFNNVYKESSENWKSMWSGNVVNLEQKYSREEIERILKDNNLTIF